VSLALYIVGGLAQTFRPPFTKPLEGALDALGGFPSLAFRWGLDLAAFAMAALGVVLFTGAGGGAWWTVLLLVKTLVFLVILAPLRRFEVGYEQLLRIFWRVAMPLALANVVLVGALVLIGVR